MFALDLRRPRSVRARKDGALPAPMPVDPAAAPVAGVSDVTAVAPMRKRFRATVRRSVAFTAVVEFDGDEGVDQYALADTLIAQIPADAWVEVPAESSYGYINNIETIGDAAGAAPAVEVPAATASRRRLSRRYRRKEGELPTDAMPAEIAPLSAAGALAEADRVRAEAEAILANDSEAEDEAAADVEALTILKTALASIVVAAGEGETDADVAAAGVAVTDLIAWIDAEMTALVIVAAIVPEDAPPAETPAEEPAATAARRYGGGRYR